jgi:hypothetical protein
MIEDIFKGEKNVELIDKHFSNFLPLKYLGPAAGPAAAATPDSDTSPPAPSPAPTPAPASDSTTEAAQ